MMDNPYAMLEIKQTATDNEIRKALKRKIELYCGSEGNYKNSDGEYLQQVFIKAAKSLLDPEKRREIDIDIAKNQKLHGVVPYNPKFKEKKSTTDNKMFNNIFKRKQPVVEYGASKNDVQEVLSTPKKDVQEMNSIIHDEPTASNGTVTKKNKKISITYINNEFIKDLKMTLKLNKSHIFERKLKLNKIYAVIGKDGSFMFAREKGILLFDMATFHNVFTGQKLLPDYYSFFADDDKPWFSEGVLDIHNTKSFVTAGSKFIPLDLIDQIGRISYNDLKEVSKFYQQYLLNNPDVVDNLFGKSYKKFR